jgi:pimeloyl-ACP methyl ester carboxylesterase
LDAARKSARGLHRLAQPSIALAELAFKNGFSAVCISSAFNSEFMEHASTAAMPAYLPVDGNDVHVALTEIDRRLNALYPGRLGDKALMGYSMGALHTLYIAATEMHTRSHSAEEENAGQKDQIPLIKFDRYVAINTPVRLGHGISKLDEFYRAPLEWEFTNRTDNIENTFLKVAALSKSTLTPQTSLPFDAVESRFLIGLTFRLKLRDIIFSSQRRNSQGVLQHRIRSYRREPAYQEILRYSYQDYFEKFAIPYYLARGIDSTAAALERAGDLRTYDAALRANPNIRVIVNQNDFLLEAGDMDWLQATFSEEQLTVFTKGGHLGNLFNPTVQKSILGALTNMKSPPPMSK